MWDPQATPVKITPELLSRFISLGEHADNKNLGEMLNQDEQMQYAPLMRLAHKQWCHQTKTLDANQLWQLIRFFTIAEMKLSGWRADEHSPVIAIARVLKDKGNPLDREQLLWLRAHSDNRFLPNGKVSG